MGSSFCAFGEAGKGASQFYPMSSDFNALVANFCNFESNTVDQSSIVFTHGISL